MNTTAPDQPDRVTRLEAIVESLAVTVGRLESTVDRVATRRTDWGMIGVFVTAVAFLCGAMVFGPLANLSKAIEDSRSHTETRYADNRRDIDKMDERLSRWIEGEQQRNNAIEAKLAAASAVDQLFMAGRLKLE